MFKPNIETKHSYICEKTKEQAESLAKYLLSQGKIKSYEETTEKYRTVNQRNYKGKILVGYEIRCIE